MKARAKRKAKGPGVKRGARPARMPAAFRLLIDSSPLMIWLSDADNRCVYFNRTWLEFTGRSLDAELGDGWRGGVHPQDRDSLQQEDRRGFDSRLDFRLEYRLRRHDGAYRWILDQCTSRHDARGRFMGYLGSCTDVTELRESAADAVKWQRRYEAALNASGWVSYELDRAAHRMLWSGGVESLIGYPPEWLTDAAGWMNHVHPDDRERLRLEVDRLEPGAPPRALQYRVRHRDGHYLWVEDRFYFVDDASAGEGEGEGSGARRNLIGFLVDVSGLRLAEEALRLSEERFRLAAEAVDGIVYEVDVRSGAVARTGRLLQRLGYGDTLPSTMAAWSQLVHPDDRAHSTQRFETLLHGEGDTAQSEYRLRDAHGNYHHVLDRVLMMRDAAGAPERMIGCTLDITALKQAEQQVLQLNSELEQRVADRTAALRAANQELEAFTYSVSHDLRAPLRHVAGFADLLRARLAAPDPMAERYLQTIVGATTRMAEMIDRLLELSRVGRGEMRPVAVDLGQLVAEVREELAPALDGRSVEWRIGRLPVVRGDRALLRGALQNLLDNAVKFTAGRTPAVIEVKAAGDVREHEVVVRDNGAGFDMKYVGKLFGVFQRLHAPGEFEGTGIGLASVRRIISRHGGRVWAEGSPGAGAEFHFTLPAREEQ